MPNPLPGTTTCAECARLRDDLLTMERSRDAWMSRCLTIEMAAHKVLDTNGPLDAHVLLGLALRGDS